MPHNEQRYAERPNYPVTSPEGRPLDNSAINQRPRPSRPEVTSRWFQPARPQVPPQARRAQDDPHPAPVLFRYRPTRRIRAQAGRSKPTLHPLSRLRQRPRRRVQQPRRRVFSRVGRNMPEPIPIILLGQLAVDTGYQGRHLGSDLLVDAAQRTHAAPAPPSNAATPTSSRHGPAGHTRTRRSWTRPMPRSRRAVESLRTAPLLPVRGHISPVSNSARADPVVQCTEAAMQYHRVRRSRRSWRPPASGTSPEGVSPRGPSGSRTRWRRTRWNHDHR